MGFYFLRLEKKSVLFNKSTLGNNIIWIAAQKACGLSSESGYYITQPIFIFSFSISLIWLLYSISWRHIHTLLTLIQFISRNNSERDNMLGSHTDNPGWLYISRLTMLWRFPLLWVAFFYDGNPFCRTPSHSIRDATQLPSNLLFKPYPGSVIFITMLYMFL